MPRHLGLMASFVIGVLLPVLATAGYLYTRAQDQFASTIAFTVRSEDSGGGGIELLGGIGRTLGGAGATGDADILYEFIRSQEMVALIDARLDLRSLYSRHAARDPLMAFDTSGTIEDLTDYWRRMVRVSLDSATGLIELRILAFTPDEAQTIATAVKEESARRIDALSAAAREDAVAWARDDLARAEARVQAARTAMTAFRARTRIVDPQVDIGGRMGVVQMLEEQLARAMVDLDMLNRNARPGDPRVQQAQNWIAVVEARLDAERGKFGSDGEFVRIMEEFERLTVDREFAERAYVAARAQHDGAQAEALRKSRYLAAYIQPTLAEASRFPQRELILALVALFSGLGWAILSLVYYSFRDRR